MVHSQCCNVHQAPEKVSDLKRRIDMLINCTNHPYSIWSDKQKNAAKKYGEVTDLPFPAVLPRYDGADLRRMTEEYSAKIIEMKPDAVMVAGEFTFAFMLVDKLLQDGIKVICTCSARQTTEVKLPDGSNEKKAVFVFERFREYEYYKGKTE